MFSEEILRDDTNRDKASDGDNIYVVSNSDDIQVVSLIEYRIVMRNKISE